MRNGEKECEKLYLMLQKETNNFSLLMDEISRYSPAEIVANKMMNESEAEILKIGKRNVSKTLD